MRVFLALLIVATPVHGNDAVQAEAKCSAPHVLSPRFKDSPLLIGCLSIKAQTGKARAISEWLPFIESDCAASQN
jgi:hypothetical protein